MTSNRTVRTANATEAVKLYADQRAVDDPAKLARATRVVRLALRSNRLTIEQLTDADGGAAA